MKSLLADHWFWYESMVVLHMKVHMFTINYLENIVAYWRFITHHDVEVPNSGV